MFDEVPFSESMSEPLRNGVYKAKEFHGRGIKIVNMGELFAYDFIGHQDMRRLVLSKSEQQKALLKAGDLLFARRSLVLEGAGHCSLVSSVPEATTFESSLIRVRLDQRVANPHFYFYLFRSPLGRAKLASIAARTAVSGIKGSDLSALRLPLLAPELQARIASILGAYDDLIEVNRRRIAVLEEMARRLFEEWFVHFRFPGHAKRQSMAVGSAEDLIDFDPPTRLPRQGEKPFVPMTQLSTSSSLIDSHEWRESGSGAKFMNGDTLFARITPCLENGKTGLVRGLPGDGVGFGSTEFIVMRGSRAGPAFTYLLARNDAFRFHAQKSMSGATGRQRARTESVRTFAFASPPKEVLDRFEALAWPMLELVGQLGETNKRLAASRDLILPRLISGDLPITTAERDLEAVA